MGLAQRLCRSDAYAVWQRVPETNTWRAIADAGLSEAYARSIAQYDGPIPSEVVHFEDVTTAPQLADRWKDFAAEGIRSILAVPFTIRGERAAVITCYYRQPQPFDPDAAAAAADLAALASQAITALVLHEEQQRLRALAEQAEQRAAYLAEASKVLASSLDYETTLRHIAQLAVPGLADWCTVELVDGDERPRQVAVAHVDPAKVEWARFVRDKLPYNPEAPTGAPNVLRTGKSELYPFIPDELLVQAVQDPEHLAILRQVGFTSVVIVPLLTRGQVLGTLSLISAESGVRYDERMLELAEEVGRRAATAIDNARLLQASQEALAAAHRNEAGVRYVMEHAHCLLWHARVTAPGITGPPYRWDLHLFDPDAAQRFLPLDLEDDQPYMVGFHQAKPPEDQLRCDQNAWAALESGEPGYRQEFRCTDRFGQNHWLHESCQIEPLEPGVWRVVGVCTDITERHALEVQARRLAAIVASSDDAIVSKDLNGVVQSWNQAAERIFGYTAEEMIGQPIVILVPPDRPNEEPEILRRIVQGLRVDHFQTERVRKDGRRIDVSVTISPIRDTTGRIIGASKIARDISVQQELQRELQLRVEALAEADRRKDEFLAMLAHELRNPLSPLTTAARIIQRVGADSPILLRQQAVIERQVRHMARLLEDLLDVSRITRGKVTLRLQELDLVQVVRGAVEACRPTVDERRHSLAVLLPEGPLRISADPVRLEQVICNLLLNAAKYTEPGGRIVVRLDVAGASARLSVRDTGLGITAEFLPSVFDLFAQAERNLDRSQGGLGIGLTLVRRLVEMHGGTVEARSEGLGQGSEFVVILPIEPGPGDRNHSKERRDNAEPGRRVQ
ncbi:MAG: domain S-box [Armatimonadetes bacterium]|nr:domain S-box [Armatimonadota bacterium]